MTQRNLPERNQVIFNARSTGSSTAAVTAARGLQPCWSHWCYLCFVCGGKMKSLCKQQCGCGRHRCWTAIPGSPAHRGAQTPCHRETETGLSGKKTNALKCPQEAEAALGTALTVRGTGQTAQWHSHRGCWCGELRDRPAAQVTAQATVPAEFHLVMSWTLSLNPSSHLYTMKNLASPSHTGTTTSALRNPGGLGARMQKRMKMDYTGLKKLFTALSLTGVLPPTHRRLLELLCIFCSKTQLCPSSPWELIFL